MKEFLLGHLHNTQEPFRLPTSSFATHWHLIGGTGKGKTTAIQTMLHGLLLDPRDEPCIVIVDRLGGLSFDLLRWIASDYCTDDVRRRLVYVEPAREEVVMGFNPLLFQTDSHAFYKVSRAAEVILKGWSSQNLSDMPRLSRWLYNSFIACALLGLTIADSVHLLLPGSEYHERLLHCLPPRLTNEWSELLGNRSGEVLRILDSTRNRLKPIFESPVLRRMFGATHNSLDMLRFMRQGKILLLNLAPGNRLPEQIADAIGGLVINEVLHTARSLRPGERKPTYLFLDEFQRFVGPDLEAAIPEVRQLGIKLILSHQSFSQLERADHDLTDLIFQCQSRMIFGVQGEDADCLAHELASIQFDPYKLKDQRYTRRQRLVGHRIIELASHSSGTSDMDSWLRQFGDGWSAARSITRGRSSTSEGESSSTSGNESRGTGGSRSLSESHGTHQQLVPIHEDFTELAGRTYFTFEEDKQVWGRKIRNASRGRAFIRLVDQPQLFDVDVKRQAPGHLAWDADRLAREMPELLDDVERLILENFKSDLFTAPELIEREAHERLQRVLLAHETIQLPATCSLNSLENPHPFA
jgi:hypothetical protein